MSKSATAVPGARATLFLSLAMTLVGGTGLMKSCTLLSTNPQDLEEMNASEEAGSEAEAAILSANHLLIEKMVVSPAMKATFIANLIASSLLLLAAFLLLSRRRSALWWTQQALVANVVHAITFVVGAFYFARANEAFLAELAATLAQAQGQSAAGGSPVLGFATGTMCSSALMLGIYAIMLRSARRRDVRAFVLREAD